MKRPLVLALLIGLSAIACRDHSDSKLHLVGAWKCVGLGDDRNNQIKKLEPQDCENCFTLYLKEDYSLAGHAVSNSFSAKYSTNSSLKQIKTFLFLYRY